MAGGWQTNWFFLWRGKHKYSYVLWDCTGSYTPSFLGICFNRNLGIDRLFLVLIIDSPMIWFLSPIMFYVYVLISAGWGHRTAPKNVKLFIRKIKLTVRLPLHPATPHWKTYSMAVRAILFSVCRHGPPKGCRTRFKRCSDAQYLFN